MLARTFETRAARRREPPRVFALMRIIRLASPSRASPYQVGELVCARRCDAVVRYARDRRALLGHVLLEVDEVVLDPVQVVGNEMARLRRREWVS